MPAPIPVVTPIDTFLELPAGGTVALSCAGSTALPGASYQWQLIEAPDGSAATLQNALTATPTLTNVDTRGTYIVFLKITDSGGSSHPQPYPVQATSVPYGFSTPLATAFGVVRVAESPTGLVKPGRGEYGWFEQGLWPIVDKINDGLSFEYYDEPTRTLTANAVMPDSTTGADAVEVNGLNITDTTASIVLTTDGNPLVIGTATTVSGVDLTVSGGLLKVDEINDASGGNLTISANASVLINGSDVLLTAADDISLSTTGADGVITLATSGATGNIALTTSGSNADISITASGSDGDISLAAAGATGGVTLLAGGGGVSIATITNGANVSLTAAGTGGVVNLSPAVSTNTTKPVFAPGFSYVDTYTVSGTGKPAMPEVVFTRHAQGSDMVVDAFTRFSLPKPDVAQLRLNRTIKDTEVTLATFSSDVSEGPDNMYMRVRCVTRRVTDTKLITHITCDISDAVTMELHSTRHVFATHTITTDESLNPFEFTFAWTGANLTDMDCCITAALTNSHTQDVL